MAYNNRSERPDSPMKRRGGPAAADCSIGCQNPVQGSRHPVKADCCKMYRTRMITWINSNKPAAFRQIQGAFYLSGHNRSFYRTCFGIHTSLFCEIYLQRSQITQGQIFHPWSHCGIHLPHRNMHACNIYLKTAFHSGKTGSHHF